MKRFFEEKFIPFASKIANQRHLIAIRDGLVLSMPLMIVGSMFIIINELPIEGYQTFMAGVFGEQWYGWVWGTVFVSTLSIIGLIAAFGIAQRLVQSYGYDGTPAGVVSVSAFLTVTMLNMDAWAWNADDFGALGLFVAIIVALISGEIYRIILKKGITVKMPESVPPSISRSFTALVPAFVIITLAFVVKMLFMTTDFGSLQGFIIENLQKPIMNVGTSLGGAIASMFSMTLFWAFGLHGDAIVGSVISPILQAGLLENTAAMGDGIEAPYIFVEGFISLMINMGGTGATLPLALWMLIFAKSQQVKKIGRLAIAPGIFNINEPIVFGLPVVLNPFLLIPYIVAPLIMVIVTYLGMAAGIFPKIVLTVPWTTPVFIGGYLATGGEIGGIFNQVINFLIAMVIWTPFIMAWDKRKLREEQETA